MKRFSTLAEWLAWFETLHPKRVDMSLDRIRVLLDGLDLTRPDYTVVTVGGTNGKGSCVAVLESIYRQAGYRVGAFTSPHLWRFNERVRFDGRDASDAELVALFETIEAALGPVTLSYFEASAVAALLHFARENADVAVLEVGMGGRLDAVNALDADGALITCVDVDHTEWLGPDREAIGREKAGIMRAGKPAVIGDPEPPDSVIEHGRRIGADLRLTGRDFRWKSGGDSWTYESADGTRAGLPAVTFGGAAQQGNAAACVALVDALAGALPVGEAALRGGLAGARLRGRSERHLRGGVEWLFDVAHNPSAAAVLRGALDEAPCAGRTHAVFGAMHDKDLDAVLAPFTDVVDRWHLALADAERGAPVERMREVLAGLGVGAASEHADIAAACAAAEADARPGDRVLVFGSFYVVGPAMNALGLYSTPS